MADMNEMKVKDVSLETLKAYVKEQEQKKKENYCVDSYEDIKVNEYKDLTFSNHCKVYSNCLGDGVTISARFVKRVVKTESNEILIFLKGTYNEFDVDDDTLLWGEKE